VATLGKIVQEFTWTVAVSNCKERMTQEAGTLGACVPCDGKDLSVYLSEESQKLDPKLALLNRGGGVPVRRRDLKKS